MKVRTGDLTVVLSVMLLAIAIGCQSEPQVVVKEAAVFPVE